VIFKIVGWLFLNFTVFNCGRKAFDDNRFIFSQKYRSLLNLYKVGDTLKFVNPTLGVRRFVMTGLDSMKTNSTRHGVKFDFKKKSYLNKTFSSPIDFFPD
jgi:hypothetical protein